jgi:hypothetical protein
MLGNILRSVFFEYVGVLTRWILYALVYKVKKRKVISFREMWEGGKGWENSGIVMPGFTNIVLGILVLVGVFLLLIKFA